nr:MAG TPA: Major tail protein [Caudoviricetes sp.]
MVTPNTIVKLYSGIPCDPTYQNVLQWDSVTEQNQFFANQVPVATYTDFQFIDGTRELRIKRQMENCYHINYVAYQNHRYGNKWFYAFVNDMRYLSSESTGLILSEDIWASWQFDLTFNKSFVERETVSNDTIGANTVPEDLELGPYTATKTSSRPFTDLQLFAQVTEVVEEATALTPMAPQKLGGLPQTVYTYNFGFLSTVNFNSVQGFIDAYAAAGKSDAIISFYLSPHIGTIGANVASEIHAPAARTLSIVPRNNKLYTYPYCALSVHTITNANVLRYELFSAAPTLKIELPFGANPTAAITPLNYEGMEYNVKYQVSAGGFPLLPWVRDYYQNWLAQNKAAQIVGAVQGVVGGAATGAYAAAKVAAGSAAGAAAGGLSGAAVLGTAALPVAAAIAIPIAFAVGKTLSQMYTAQVMPDTLTGSASAADVNSASGANGLYTECMAIRPEYARIIDDYFSMYGYAVHRAKNIELHSRTNWNYIKTIGANIEGNCPAPVLASIKNMFDNGVTLWHNGTFNYGTLSNPIITS